MFGVLMAVGAFMAQGYGTAGMVVVAFVGGACAEHGLGIFRN